MGKPFINLTDQIFTEWTVSPKHKSVPRPSGKGSPRTHWFCTCSCGNTAWVDSTNLRQGISTNCGCKRETKSAKQQAARSASGKANITHGMNRSNKLRTRLYNIWASMKTRCDNPKQIGYKYYGGRGITYCPEWKSFEPFQSFALANGYNDSLTIDRINSNGNYEPKNCRFIPQKQQLRNTSRNIYLAPTLTVSEFCETHGVSYDLVWHTYYLKTSHPDVFDKLMQLL